MSDLEAATQRFLEQARAGAEAGPELPGFASRLRQDGRDVFAAQGLPTTRLEEWRYTPLGALGESAFAPAARDLPHPDRASVESHAFPVYACSFFVFVNGRFAPDLSSPASLAGGVRVESLAHLLREEPERLEPHLGQVIDPKQHPLAALNTACLEDGAVVLVPRSAAESQTLHLVFVTSAPSPALAHPRILVVAEPGSRAAVIQDHVSLEDEAAHFTNAVTEVVLGANAQLDLATIQRESARCLLTANLAVRQDRDSRFTSHVVTLGGRLVRNDLSVLLGEEGAECDLQGLFLGTGDGLVDNHTLVDHAVPHCTSRELYKGILAQRSKGVFRGRVMVRPGAQKTSAEQSNPNLLLHDGAEVDTKPQLEIYADDVKCSHGSAIGRIDPEALFYLRARGIGADEARRLLTRGFAAEVLRALPEASLGEALAELLAEQLEGAERTIR